LSALVWFGIVAAHSSTISFHFIINLLKSTSCFVFAAAGVLFEMTKYNSNPEDG
jgi:hypothetical protein